MNNEKFLIVYHKEDNDGLFSMALIYNYLVTSLNVNPGNIDIDGLDYNDVKNITASDNTTIKEWCDDYDYLFMTDISITSDDCKEMKTLKKHFCNRFVWIDHHAPIIKLSQKFGFDDIMGIRDKGRSAIMNAYKCLYDEFDNNYILLKEEKTDKKYCGLYVLYMLSLYDSFTFSPEDADYVTKFNRGMLDELKLDPQKVILYVSSLIMKDNNEMRPNITFWKYNIDKCVARGEAILNIMDDYYETLIRQCSEIWNIGERKAVVLFAQGASSSNMFKSVAGVYDNGLIFKHNQGGGWTISLYNITPDNSFHCGNYLHDNYGGGGHEGAAGCIITDEQFMQILNNKTI